MEATIARHFFHRLLRPPLLLRRLAVLLTHLPPLYNRRLSLVALKDFQLSLFFLLCGLSTRTVSFTAGGSATSIQIWIPRRRRQGKPALVLIHGFGGNSKWQFHDQIGTLSRSFDLYIPDLVFFGRSASATAERSVGFQSRCVAAAMRDLGVVKYSVAGISYGGFVAFRLAAEAAEVVERVVILTSGICATTEEMNALAGREKRDVSEILLPRRAEDLMALMRRSLHRPPKWLPAFLLRDFVEVMYKDQREERVELLLELLSNGLDLHPLPVLSKVWLFEHSKLQVPVNALLSPRICRWSAKASFSYKFCTQLSSRLWPNKEEVLIIWGDKDNVFPISLGHRLQRHLGGNARLEVIADAGHAVQLEKPHIVNHLILSFLLQSTILLSP
ncbi:hypothetical protein KSP40_PGU019055 [Platanthera guangdongensis]|uniref:AB hydrolase-1 domain-containing protein n=1 Tax=Platanthera guangdongensis TaxID=2320717 RepID=A0ABR2LJM3_9ASPA